MLLLQMCLRGNMKIINNEEYFCLFIHLMKGENDDIINWPFEGKVFITVKNRDTNLLHREDFHDTIVTTTESEALQRPSRYDRNEVGIGPADFIRINALYSGGFVVRNSPITSKDYHLNDHGKPHISSDDILVIKVNVVCTGNDE